MFWTAMVCGAGASLGACVGLFVFALSVGALLRAGKQDGQNIARESLDALHERNRLTVLTLERLDTIVAVLDRK